MTRRSEHPPAHQVDLHLVHNSWKRLTALWGVPSVWALVEVAEITSDLLRGIEWSDKHAHLFRLVQWTDGLARRELLRGPHAWPEDQVDRRIPWSSELTEHCISLIGELERLAKDLSCPEDLSKTAIDL
jgi:hypothetical protein